jgi:serine/threonine-protein kinase RsbW
MSQKHEERRSPYVANAPYLRWWRSFPGVPASARGVRRWLRELLPECDPLDDLSLVASELAANAVLHTASGAPGGEFDMDLSWSPRFVRVVVGDGGARSEPTAVESPAGTSGRGLSGVVAGLAAAWGHSGGADGRWVWADIAWGERGGPLLPVPDEESLPRAEVLVLRQRFPGAVIWYEDAMRAWCGQSVAADTGLIEAPSPRVLACLLADAGELPLSVPRQFAADPAEGGSCAPAWR